MNKPDNTKLDEIDYIIHDFLHNNINLEDAIMLCENGKEVGELIRRLVNMKAITEQEYDQAIQTLHQQGQLGKFAETKE